MSHFGTDDPIVFTLLAESVVILIVSLSIVGTLAFNAGARALRKHRES